MWEEFPEAVGTTIYEKYHEAMREHNSVEFESYLPPTSTTSPSRSSPMP
jgi:hypothetical protein